MATRLPNCFELAGAFFQDCNLAIDAQNLRYLLFELGVAVLPIGLAALLTAQFYSPAEIIMIDLDDNRLEIAKRFGATAAINNADGKAVETVMKMAGERGVDTAIEAVGIPATFELCGKIVAPGGTIANIGVHGTKVDLHLEELWDRNINITTRLVDTVSTPMLSKVCGLISHRHDVKNPRARRPSTATPWDL